MAAGLVDEVGNNAAYNVSTDSIANCVYKALLVYSALCNSQYILVDIWGQDCPC